MSLSLNISVFTNSSFFLENVNFLIADGIKFAHPLHHLGKSKEDLPLIAIDSFRHMYLFPDYKEMETPGKVKQFLADLYSGKLHREFHYGPDQTSSDEPVTDDNTVSLSPVLPSILRQTIGRFYGFFKIL